MEETTEQNKTEEATPFKLKRARERGVVARGVDLGFFAALSGAAIFAVVAGNAALAHLALALRHTLAEAPTAAHDAERAIEVAAIGFAPAFQTIALIAGTTAFVVIVFEIVQVRGLAFTAKPLKPDFNRLNPAKGLKRLFSLRMLKETLKSLIKLALYSAGAWFTVKFAVDTYSRSIDGAPRLGEAMQDMSLRLLFCFILIAFLIAILDQVLSRGEFLKQMRMSRSELVREHKEREGEPRLKQKRKQLHAEFTRQTRALADLAGSDMLIVNPEHFAVALKYDGTRMEAPCVTAKGRNRLALHLKRKAYIASILVLEDPPLARALYQACAPGDEVPSSHYGRVANLYLKLRAARAEAKS